MSTFNQTLQLVSGNHSNIAAFATTDDNDFPVFNDLVAKAGKMCPGIGIGCL